MQITTSRRLILVPFRKGLSSETMDDKFCSLLEAACEASKHHEPQELVCSLVLLIAHAWSFLVIPANSPPELFRLTRNF